jgi:hypothetical protein
MENSSIQRAGDEIQISSLDGANEWKFREFKERVMRFKYHPSMGLTNGKFEYSKSG